MEAFDPDESDECTEAGFVMITPSDIPSCIPSRSLCDNMESQRHVTGFMRTQNMDSLGTEEGHVTAYSGVQFGVKAGASDAATVGLDEPKAAFRDNGMDEFDNHQAKELYKSANGPMKHDDDDE